MPFMSNKTVLAAALAGLSASFPAPAPASPVSPAQIGPALQSRATGETLVQKASGCHAVAAHHMVFKWGRKAWHRHGPNCQPLPAVNYNCHRAFRNHGHPGFGGGWHRHVGPGCVPFRGRVWTGGPKHGCVKIGALWICG